MAKPDPVHAAALDALLSNTNGVLSRLTCASYVLSESGVVDSDEVASHAVAVLRQGVVELEQIRDGLDSAAAGRAPA